METIDKETKKQIYANKEELIVLNKRIDMLEREHALSRRELKEDIKQIQKETVSQIKEMLSIEYKENQKWKDRTLIGLVISLFLICVSVFLNSVGMI